MYDKAILENDGSLKSVPDCCKSQKLCDKAASNYPHALQSVSKCYKTPEMCYKAVYRYFFYLILFLINIKHKKYVT